MESGQMKEQGPGTAWESLFVRPDDRWEANDVATLRPDIAAALRAAAADFEACCRLPTAGQLSPLDDLLLEPV
jgi:hypothetical protein